MNVSSVISSSNLVNSIFATTSAQRVAFSIVTPATGNASTVDISALGQLLSASSILNRTLATDNPGFATVVAATQIFINAFNTVAQSDVMQNTSESYAGSLFEQTLNSSVIEQLAKVGSAIRRQRRTQPVS